MTTLECIPQSPDFKTQGSFTMATVLRYPEGQADDDLDRSPPMESTGDDNFDIDELIRRLELHRQELRMASVRQKTEALKNKRASIASSYQPRYSTSRRQTKVIDAETMAEAFEEFRKLDQARIKDDSNCRRSSSITKSDLHARPIYGSREDLSLDAAEEQQRKRMNRRSLAVFRPHRSSKSTNGSSKESSNLPSRPLSVALYNDITPPAVVDVFPDAWPLPVHVPDRPCARILSRPGTAIQPADGIYWSSLSVRERNVPQVKGMQEKDRQEKERQVKKMRRQTWVSSPSLPQHWPLPEDSPELLPSQKPGFLDKVARRMSRIPPAASVPLLAEDWDKENQRPKTASGAGDWPLRGNKRGATMSARASDASQPSGVKNKKVLKEKAKKTKKSRGFFGLFRRRKV